MRICKKHLDGTTVVVREYEDDCVINEYRYPPKAGIILLNPTESHVLMCQNAYTYAEEHRELWGLPKGHVEAGETLIDTAIREFSEETGLDITSSLRKLCTGANAVRHMNSVFFVIRMTANTYQEYKNLDYLNVNSIGKETVRIDWIPINKVIQREKGLETNKETYLVLNENMRRFAKIAREI